MRKVDARKLRSFQGQNLAYEKLLLRHLRGFLNKEGANLMHLALTSDWDGFHETCLKVKDRIKPVVTYIYGESGEQAIGELR